MDKDKKIFILIIAAAVLVSFLVGYIVTHPNISNEPGRGLISDRFDGNQIPDINDSRINLLATEKAVSIVNSLLNNSILFYEPDSGKVFEVDLKSQNKIEISASILPDFIEAVWSPTRREVVGLFHSSSGGEYRYYSYDTGRSSVLEISIKSVSFSPKGDKIVFFEDTGEAGNISISTPDGKIFQKILDTRLKNITLDWIDDNKILIRSVNSSNLISIYELTLDGELKKMEGEVSNIEVRPALGKNKYLLSFKDSRGYLNLYSVIDGKKNLIKMEAGADSCGWSVDDINIFCVRLTDETNTYGVFRFNIKDGESEILNADIKIKPDLVILSNDEDYLILRNSLDGRLYTLKVK